MSFAPRPQTPPCRLAAGLGLVGVGCYMAAFGRDGDLVALAVLLVLAAGIVWGTNSVIAEIRKVNRPADQAWHDGYEIGHDKGWQAGYAAANPNVVKLVTADDEQGRAQLG